MKKYISNLFWMLSDRVLVLIFQLLLFSLIKNTYGLETLGGWSVITNVSQLLLSFFLLGIDIIIVKRVIEDPASAGKELGTALAIQLIGILLYTITLLSTTHLFYSNIKNAYFFAFILIFSNFFNVFSKIIYIHYSALVESKFRAITIILSSVSSYVFLYISIKLSFSIFYSYLFFYLYQSILAIIIYKLYFKKNSSWSFNFHTSKYYFFTGLKLTISSISVSLFAQSDIIILEKMTTPMDAGSYSAALRISTIWFMCAGIIANAFFPKIVELVHKNNQSLYIFFEWICSITVSLAFYVALVTSLLAPFIINTIYGSNMDLSTQILAIHIWAGIFIFLGSFSSKWLYAKNMINIDIYKTLVAAIFNVILNIIFIPLYGAIGAAYISVLSYFIANMLFFIFIKNTRKLLYLQVKSIFYIFTPWILIRRYPRIKCLFQ